MPHHPPRFHMFSRICPDFCSTSAKAVVSPVQAEGGRLHVTSHQCHVVCCCFTSLRVCRHRSRHSAMQQCTAKSADVHPQSSVQPACTVCLSPHFFTRVSWQRCMRARAPVRMHVMFVTVCGHLRQGDSRSKHVHLYAPVDITRQIIWNICTSTTVSSLSTQNHQPRQTKK